jgi:pyruvate carboxylase
LGHRWREVEKTYAEVNHLFQIRVKVIPSSGVGDMALFPATKGMHPQDLLNRFQHDLALPTLW